MCCHGNEHSRKEDIFVMGALAKRENYTPVFSSYKDTTSRRDHELDVYVPGSVGAGCYGDKSGRVVQ